MPIAPVTPPAPVAPQPSTPDVGGAAAAGAAAGAGMYSSLPPHQAVFEPQHQDFDWEQFNARFQSTVQKFIDTTGAWPAAGIARDLTRSGLPLDAVGEIARHMTQNPPPPGQQLYPDDVHAVQQLPSSLRDEVRSKPFFSVPDAPFQGVVYDAANDRFLVNQKEDAPASAMAFQFQKSTLTPEAAVAMLNQIRQTDPQKIASVMDLIDQGDYQGAALKAAPVAAVVHETQKQPSLWDNIVNAGKASVGQAAGIVGDQVSAAHDVAVKASLASVKAFAEVGLIHQDENSPLGVGLGASAESAGGQAILTLEGKPKGGANVTLTPQAYEQLKKLYGDKAAASFDPSKNQAPGLLEKLGAGFGLATTAFQIFPKVIEDSVAENGAPPLVAHTAGLVASFLGVGGLPKNLGTLGKVAGGVGAVGGGAQAFLSTEGEDPILRAEDVAAGSAQGGLGLAQLGHGVSSAMLHRQMTASIQATLRSKVIQEVNDATAARIEAQTKAGMAQQTVADAHAQNAQEARERLDAIAPKEAPPARLGNDQVADLQKQVNELGRTDMEGARKLQEPIDREMNLRFQDEVARKQAERERVQNTPEVKAAQAALERADTPAARAIAQRELAKATNAASLTAPVSTAKVAAPSVTQNRERLTGLVAQVKNLTAEIAEARRKGVDPTELVNQRQDLVVKANDHVNSADLGKTPAQLEGERELFNASSDLQLANKRDFAASSESFSKDASDALDRVIAARQKIDDSHWMNPIRKILNNEWVEAAKEHSIEQAKADRMREEVSRQIEGDQNTDLRRTLNTLNTHLKYTISNEKNPTSVLGSGGRHATTMGLLAQKVAHHIVEAIGNEPGERWQQFREAFWHPETLDQIADPAIRQAVIDVRAGFADMAGQIGEEAKNEIVRDYFPLLTTASRERFQRVLMPENPLPVSTTHLKERVQPSDLSRDLEAEKAMNPAAEVGSYFHAMGRAIVNQQIRAAFKESVFEKDNAPVFISFDDVPRHTKPPDNGHEYIQSGLAGLDGWVEKSAGEKLKDMTTSPTTGNKVSDAMAGFNNVYKRLAMISPQHFWNQVSASLGMDGPWAIKGGNEVAHSPELLADAARHMHVQMEGVIAELSERAIKKDPQLAPFLDSVRNPARAAYMGYEHLLWEKAIKNLQLGMYEKLVTKLASEGHELEDAKIAAGHLIGQVTGVGDAKMMAKWERGFQRYVAFAYQWNKKHVTIPAEALPFVGRKAAKYFNPELSDQQAYLVEAQARKYMAKYAAVAGSTLFAANILMSGHPSLENEKGHELDLEWTRMHDLLYGSDGQRHYVQFPAMNFARFYQSKAQVFADYGPKNLAEGALQNLANITMPLPSWAISTALGAHEGETTSALVGRTLQTLNPFERNIFGPIAKDVVNTQKGKVENQGGVGGSALSILRDTANTWLGLREYTGAHQPYVQHSTVLQNDRGVDLVLALDMHINPIVATPEQRQEAQQKLDAGSFLGIQPKEVLSELGGAPIGTNSAYSQISAEFENRIKTAVLEQGVSQAALDAAIKNGKSPFSLLDPTQKKLLFVAHPEIGYALDAASTDPDPRVRQQKADLSRFYYGLQQTLNDNHLKQQQFDAAFQSGKMLLKDWISNSKALRTESAQAYDILGKSLSPQEKELINKPPSDTTPLLPSEQAYFHYHQISLSDSKYQNDDGTQDVKQWRADQQTYLDALPYDQQQYIRNRDLQNRTDLEKAYFAASDTYAKFRAANQTYEDQRTVYDQLTPFQRKLYLEENPGLKGYFDFRNTWFTQNPDAAKFFHPMNEEQWAQWNPTQQAMNMAEWYIDSWGSVKEQAFLTPWQKQVTQDPKLFAQLTNGWDPKTYQAMNDAINAYYTNQDAQRASFHALLSRIFSKGRSGASRGYSSGGSQNALGG